MKYVERATGLLRSYAAHLALLAALGGLVVVVHIGFWAFTGPVIGAIFGGVLGIVLKTDVETPQATRRLDWRLGWIATSLYVFLTIAIYRPVSRTRPLAYYVLFGLMTGFLAYQVYDGQSRKHVLPQLLVFAFITYWTTQFAFPAGVNSPDTFAFVPAIARIIEQAAIPENIIYGSTPGHMIYVAEAALLTGESVQLIYYLLATAALVVTIVFIASFGDVIPGLDRQVALFAALLFSVMSFTLLRGLFPTKLSFYKPLIIIGILAVYHALYSKPVSRRYVPIVAVSAAALVFGHTYSLGATMIVMGVLGGFKLFTRLFQGLDYDSAVPSGSTMTVVLVFPLVLFGYALAGGSGILGRVASILLSLVEVFFQVGTETATGSGGGRYSTLSINVLIFSTVGQAILFAFGVSGVAIAVRRRNWDYDSIIAWIVGGFSLIALSIFVNAVAIPTPRIYGLLAIFGLNMTMVLGLYALGQMVPREHGKAVVAVIIAVFAVFSLASPVAGTIMSPVDDEIPHFRKYTTAQNEQSDQWVSKYVGPDAYNSEGPSTEIPMRATANPKHAVVDRSEISPGTVYIYTELSAATGVTAKTNTRGIGGREYVFLSLPDPAQRDSNVYSNGETSMYIRKSSA